MKKVQGTIPCTKRTVVNEISRETRAVPYEIKRFKRIGIPDEFPDEYGSQDSLMDRYSINAQRVTELVLGLSDPGNPMSPAQKIFRA